MVSAKEIKAKLTASPFVPFVVQTTRTGSYPIRSADAAFVTKTTLYVLEDIDRDGIAGDARPVPIAQISRLEA